MIHFKVIIIIGPKSILARNIMLSHDTEDIHIIDFGAACQRCSECSDCNDSSEYHANLNCESCKKWHDGRIKDLREVAILIYQLVMAPLMSAHDSRHEIFNKEKEYIKAKVPH